MKLMKLCRVKKLSGIVVLFLPLFFSAAAQAQPSVVVSPFGPSVVVSPFGSITEGLLADYLMQLDDQPSADVMVNLSSVSGEIDAVVEIEVRTLIFTDTNWNRTQTLLVLAVPDDDANDESVEVTFSVTSADPRFNGMTITDIITVEDDDTAGVTVSTPTLKLDEGATDNYTLVLTSLPAADVMITVASGDMDAASVNPRTLTFTDANWNTARTVMVTGGEDDDANNEVNVQLTHTASSTDATYNGNAVTIAGVTV